MGTFLDTLMEKKTPPVLSDLKPYGNNAKKHPKSQVAHVAQLIERFGFTQPIVVDENNEIIIGHCRHLAAGLLGLEEVRLGEGMAPKGSKWVPVVKMEGLTEEEKKTLRLADNKSNESAWEMAKVILDIKSIPVDLQKLTGFSLSLGIKPEEGEDDAPDLPEKPKSKRGEVYQLGKHRLMCGDATSEEDVKKLIEDNQMALMVTDPPYGVNYDPEWREGVDLGVGKRSKGKVSNDDCVDWSAAYNLFNGDVAYVWHSAIHGMEVGQNLIDSGFDIVAQIVWVKQHFALSRGDYHWQHEPCYYVVRKKAKHNWQGSRRESTVWEIKNNNSFGNAEKEETWGHGTQKPMECMERPIVNNSEIGQNVYDPFGGSGTTLIACEKTNRQCYMMELDPRYIDVILERYQKFTGEEPIKLSG